MINPATAARTIEPRLVVDSTLPFNFQSGTGQVRVNGHETITASLRLTRLVEEQKPRRVIQLASLTAPAGRSATFFVLYSAGDPVVTEPTTDSEPVTLCIRSSRDVRLDFLRSPVNVCIVWQPSQSRCACPKT